MHVIVSVQAVVCDLSIDHSQLLSEEFSGFITVQYKSHLIMYREYYR